MVVFAFSADHSSANCDSELQEVEPDFGETVWKPVASMVHCHHCYTESFYVLYE